MDPALCQAREMVRDIVALTEIFPNKHRRGRGYWHMHVPVNGKLIDGSRARKTVRRLCIQTLIDRAYHLWTLKPRQLQKSKVVVAIDSPNLSDSQIIIFFSEEYFARFFDRIYSGLPAGGSS
jgi:hypothetical protein